MRCERCESEWQSPGKTQSIFCPFCHASLIKIQEEFNDISSVLSFLVSKFGTEILRDRQNTLYFMEEFFQDGKRETNFLSNLYASGLMETLFRLQNAPKPIQKSATAQVKKQFIDKYGVSKEWSEYVVGSVCKALGIAENSDESLIEIKHSAERDIPSAQIKLAKRYQIGQGVEKSYEQYFYWLRRAAENNVAEAQYLLGTELYHGFLCEKNLGLATSYLGQAIKNKYIDAMCFVLLNVDAEGMNKFEVIEIANFLVAKKNELSPKQLVQLSKYFENKDLPLALLLAKLSYDSDSKSSWQYYVDLLQKSITRENEATALRVIKDAATEGSSAACLLLGQKYENQAHAENDMLLSLYWYRIAAEAGELEAQLRLGDIYEGKGILNQDLETAAYWYKIAAYNGSAYAKSKVSYKSPECILKTITLIFEDDTDLECKVLNAVNHNGMDYLIIEDPETKEHIPIKYTEDDTIEGFEIEMVDEKTEEILLDKFDGAAK